MYDEPVMTNMNGDILRVEKMANGFSVSVCDPEIMAANEKPKSNYKSAWVEYAFTTSAEVTAFVTAHLDSLKPEPDEKTQYGQEFARQAAKMDDSK